MKKALAMVLVAFVLLTSVFAAAEAEKSTESKKVVIYTALSATRSDPIQAAIREQFPDYEIVYEYMGLSELVAKLKNEGTDTEIDIAQDLSFLYMDQMPDLWADHSGYNQSIFVPSVRTNGTYLPFAMYSGCVAVNMDVLNAKGLAVPSSWEDLLKPEYKELISMPNPASSGTGYIFLRMLTNLWGEDKTFAYFDELAKNVLAFTSSGSAPLNSLKTGEVGIALCMTYQAAIQMDKGVNLKIMDFEGGYPWACDGAAIIKGHETSKAVKDVYEFIYSTCIYNDLQYCPESILLGLDGGLENFPKDIAQKYGNMANDTLEEKQRLLSKWVH